MRVKAIAAALREAGRVEEAERVEKRIKMTRVEHGQTLEHILSLKQEEEAPAPAPKMDIDKRVVQPTAVFPLAHFADYSTTRD